MKRINGEGSIFPIPSATCLHCTRRSEDHSKHAGRWKAKAVINGKVIRRNAANRTLALRAIDEIKADQATGQLVVGRSQSVGSYVKTWLDERDPLMPNAGVQKLAYSTILSYRSRAALFEMVGKVQLRRLEPADVRRALAALSAKNYSPTTISDARVLLATVLKSAMRERPPKVTFNAAELVDHIRRDKTEKFALDEEQAGRFLKAARKYPELYSAFLVALQFAPRSGELWATRWKAIDWTGRRLHISESLYWIGSGEDRPRAWATKTPKTEKGDRYIDLSETALAALRDHRTAQTERLGAVPHPESFIWTTDAGGPVEHRHVLRSVFYPICEAARLPYVGRHHCGDPENHRGCAFLTFHGLRHSAITIALAATKDVIAVSRMAGHASAAFTQDVYGHVLKKQQRAIADYMDQALPG